MDTSKWSNNSPSKHCALTARLTMELNDDGSNVCCVTVPLFAGSVMNDKRDCHNFFASGSDMLVETFDGAVLAVILSVTLAGCFNPSESSRILGCNLVDPSHLRCSCTSLTRSPRRHLAMSLLVSISYSQEIQEIWSCRCVMYIKSYSARTESRGPPPDAVIQIEPEYVVPVDSIKLSLGERRH